MKIATVRCLNALTEDQRAKVRENVLAQLPAGWRVIVIDKAMSIDFLDTKAPKQGKTPPDDVITFSSAVNYKPNEIITKAPRPFLRGLLDDIDLGDFWDNLFGIGHPLTTKPPPEAPEPPPTRHVVDGKQTAASKAETDAWADRVREATGRGLTVIGRAGGAPPKVMNGSYETGKSIAMYAHWLMANPHAQCDHEFVGKVAPGEFLTCLYCHRSRQLPEEKE